ncbi:hypothetical protein LCGC14_3116890 [marine sediment metagenome]|uniref:Methyltransferase domain-containing protein n=1 Tax=marine sediment metagenome TaxID=412755 RepID=A0A0F8YAW3_9ZZZZ
MTIFIVNNNIIFAKWALGFDVYGVDMSETAIDFAKNRFDIAGLEYKSLQERDIRKLKFNNDFFDAVIDRTAIQHNTFKEAKQIASEVHRVLKPKGHFYSCLVTNDYQDEHVGVTRHFYTQDEIKELFSSFEIMHWYYTTCSEVLTPEKITGFYHVELRKV